MSRAMTTARVTVHESCSCGATFDYASEWNAEAREACKQWREGHKHAESAGICGNELPEGLPGGHRSWCVLKAGHTGMHGNGEGGHWRPTQEVGTRAALADAPGTEDA